MASASAMPAYGRATPAAGGLRCGPWFAIWCLLAGVPAIVAAETDTTPPELAGRSLLESVGSETTGGRWFVYITEPLDEDSLPVVRA